MFPSVLIANPFNFLSLEKAAGSITI